MNLAIRFISLMFVLNFVVAATCWAKQSPPPELETLIGGLSKFESQFESEKWQEATLSLDDFSGKINQILKNDPEAAKKFNLQLVLKQLRVAIEHKSHKLAEDNYINFQKILLLLTERYDYAMPPVLRIMDKYLNQEAAEALEKEDYDEVYSEMREVGTFFRMIEATLKKKGVSEENLRSFNDKLIQIIKECRQDDKSSIKDHFQELRKLFASFLALYPAGK